ncbi:MAG: hypothetical protein WC530_07545 [Candidatus Omnitrophota bacterium]|jgi:hypothetical protein
MNYFKILSIVLGAGMVLGGVWAVFSVEGLKRLIAKLYPEERPRWLLIAGALVLALVLWTWMELAKAVPILINFRESEIGAVLANHQETKLVARAASMENFVVTLVVSLGLIKVVPLVFFYKKSREFLTALLAEPLAFRVVVLSSAAIGLGLLVMGLVF